MTVRIKRYQEEFAGSELTIRAMKHIVSYLEEMRIPEDAKVRIDISSRDHPGELPMTSVTAEWREET